MYEPSSVVRTDYPAAWYDSMYRSARPGRSLSLSLSFSLSLSLFLALSLSFSLSIVGLSTIVVDNKFSRMLGPWLRPSIHVHRVGHYSNNLLWEEYTNLLFLQECPRLVMLALPCPLCLGRRSKSTGCVYCWVNLKVEVGWCVSKQIDCHRNFAVVSVFPLFFHTYGTRDPSEHVACVLNAAKRISSDSDLLSNVAKRISSDLDSVHVSDEYIGTI